jgi:hypothetical protein
MWAAVAQGGIVSPVLFSLYVNDIPTPSRHVQLAQYQPTNQKANYGRSQAQARDVVPC